jgi:hypothetical protein
LSATTRPEGTLVEIFVKKFINWCLKFCGRV